jgi:hypothetical protein
MYGFGNGQNGYGYRDPIDPSARPDRAPSGRLDAAGKAGKAFVKALGSLSFDANLFAYYVVSHARGALRRRVMSVVFALVKTFADAYDHGDMDEDTMNAKRLTDTMALYHMED